MLQFEQYNMWPVLDWKYSFSQSRVTQSIPFEDMKYCSQSGRELLGSLPNFSKFMWAHNRESRQKMLLAKWWLKLELPIQVTLQLSFLSFIFTWILLADKDLKQIVLMSFHLDSSFVLFENRCEIYRSREPSETWTILMGETLPVTPAFVFFGDKI